MAYLIAWGIYLLMAVLLALGFERYLVPRLAAYPQLRIFLRSLIWIGLFTPGFVVADGSAYVVPAAVGVMFNLLAHQYIALLKAALPLLLVTTVVFTVLAFRSDPDAGRG